MFKEALKNAAPISEKRDAIESARGQFLLDRSFLNSQATVLLSPECGAGPIFFASCIARMLLPDLGAV
jgi:hypothetical protein